MSKKRFSKIVFFSITDFSKNQIRKAIRLARKIMGVHVFILAGSNTIKDFVDSYNKQCQYLRFDSNESSFGIIDAYYFHPPKHRKTLYSFEELELWLKEFKEREELNKK